MVDPSAEFRAYNTVRVTSTLATSGVIPADEFERIAQAGYRTVINLLPEENQHALEDEASIVAALGMAYVHIPIDIEAPTVENFDEFRAAMKAHSDSPVWVHCAANWRVSAFVALYGQLELGWSPDRATDFVGGIWQPTAPWISLAERILAREHDEK
ncbi:MAG: protein tyrosine phosphatase family protein [Deltaproteobacteria bacterium]|nr:protein tyrosine phosphatase family protein [Deltaproteobacteria bacterium]MBW2362454.1 protein tyrosine phosphatase family protein [Deltaproteobacteria bacterium]